MSPRLRAARPAGQTAKARNGRNCQRPCAACAADLRHRSRSPKQQRPPPPVRVEHKLYVFQRLFISGANCLIMGHIIRAFTHRIFCVKAVAVCRVPADKNGWRVPGTPTAGAAFVLNFFSSSRLIPLETIFSCGIPGHEKGAFRLPPPENIVGYNRGFYRVSIHAPRATLEKLYHGLVYI